MVINGYDCVGSSDGRRSAMSEEDIGHYGERRLQRSVDELAEEFHGIWLRETIDRSLVPAASA
jgi:hypothetical protein